MASFLKKALPGVLPPALAANPDLNAEGMNGTVLASIVTAAASRTFSEAVSIRAVREMRATRVTRAAVLERALRASGRRFILEVKAASPSEGLMRGTVDTDVYARTYSRFADAVSVVTEPEFFAGSFDRLADIRQKTVLPILAKDFFVKEEQILAAARAGADAVLLMLSVLSDVGYRKLAAFAQSLGLEILTEVDSETDLVRARQLGVRLIGINNRDLRTLSPLIGVALKHCLTWLRRTRSLWRNRVTQRRRIWRLLRPGCFYAVRRFRKRPTFPSAFGNFFTEKAKSAASRERKMPWRRPKPELSPSASSLRNALLARCRRQPRRSCRRRFGVKLKSRGFRWKSLRWRMCRR